MSGPKIDHAALERQRQAELERKRQEKLRALEEFAQAVQRIDALARKVEALREGSVSRFEQDSDMRYQVEAIRAAADTAMGSIRAARTTQPWGEAEQIRAQTRNMQARALEIERGFDTAATAFEKQVEQYLGMLQEQQERRALSEKLASCKEERYAFNVVSFALADEAPATVPTELDVSTLTAEIKLLVKHPAAGRNRERLLALLAAVAKEPNRQRQQALLTQYVALRNGIWQDIREFGLYYRQYHAFYFAWAQLRYAGQPQYPPPRPQESFGSAVELKTEVSRLQKAHKQEDEQAYIRKALDEVMREFGYATLEPIQLHSLQQGQTHYLAEAKDSGQAPLHISISENGEILMEVQALDAGNPENAYEVLGNSQKDAEERKYVSQQQAAFCSQHPKMLEALRQRGVELRSKRHVPPGEFCVKLRVKGKRSSYEQYKARFDQVGGTTQHERELK